MELPVSHIGFWLALCTSVFAIMYIVPQLIQGIAIPETKAFVEWILTPSLFLAPSFLIMIVANAAIAPIILPTQIYPAMAYAGASWFIMLSASSVLVALLLKNVKLSI